MKQTVGLKPEISILVPIHNEEEALPALLDKIRQYQMAGWHRLCEWIFIDDGSTDRSPEILRQHLPLIQILSIRRRSGMGRALKLGSGLARGDFVVWMDGDGTYDFRDLMRLLSRRHEADQVIGCRRRDCGCFGPLRFAVKRLTAFGASILMGRWIPDLNCGLRVLRSASVGRWCRLLPNEFCSTTATLAALAAGQKVVFEPVSYGSRVRGSVSKFHPVKDGLHVLNQIFQVWLWRRELKSV